jgi:hypothetical protein
MHLLHSYQAFRLSRTHTPFCTPFLLHSFVFIVGLGNADGVCVLIKGLEGSAEPAIPGDDLDVTKQTKSYSPSQNRLHDANDNLALKVPDSTSGLSLFAKLFYASLIVVVCVAFVRTRRTPSWSDKSIA